VSGRKGITSGWEEDGEEGNCDGGALNGWVEEDAKTQSDNEKSDD
jgi:hypothetical protein